MGINGSIGGFRVSANAIVVMGNQDADSSSEVVSLTWVDDNNYPQSVLTNNDASNSDTSHDYDKEKALLSRSNCSCWSSPEEIETCCQRLVVSCQKFGTIYSYQWVSRYRPYLDIKVLHPKLVARIGPRGYIRDYRHVAVVRNAYQAVVSGYLYHRSGHECWVDPWGSNWTENYYAMWETDLNASMYRPMIGSYPLVGNRDLCTYLLDEAELMGMKLYMAFILHKEYDDVARYMKRAQKNAALDHVNRTLALCLEYAAGTDTQEKAFYEIMNFLFPGGHNHTYPTDVYGPGGHGTDHNPEMRHRLQNLVHELDRTMFNGALAKVNSYYNCSEISS